MPEVDARSGCPELRGLEEILGMCLCRECPVNSKDVDLAMKIFGEDVAVLKGKTVKPKPPVVGKEDVIDLPPELSIEMVELAIDVIYVSTELFYIPLTERLRRSA